MMSVPPFTGRKPIFIGDDITDHAAFAVLPDFTGIGFSVGGVVPRRELQFRRTAGRAALVAAPERGAVSAMTAATRTDYGLDLAIIGNGRTAALLEPSSRITWWCFPRFDSDPVFCRLLAGDEEKGFTDVVLDGLKDVKSRISAQHRRSSSPN